MDANRQIWQSWAATLDRWGLRAWAAALLDAAGPLTLLGAQAIYLGQPLFRHTAAAGHLAALAQMLDEPGQAQALADFLREEKPL